jgi:hypothetical protein
VTDDLVKRLREEVNDHMFGIIQSPLQLEAADLIESQFKLLERSGEVLALLYSRIEQLEAALRDVSHIHDGNPSPAMAGMPDVDYARLVLGETRRVARAALGEKKDG